MAKPRVLVLYTGGTIGMRKTADGYQPEPRYLQRLLYQSPRFGAPDVPDFDIHEFSPLLDSSDMTPAEWVAIAQAVRTGHDAYDGFLVLHGTDTMAYTASALSFMLEGLRKPVLLTGSQIPLEETRNDAQDNLLTSFVILGRHHTRLCEVFVCFANRLLRGNRASKTNADDFDAFSSPNFPAVGRAGIEIAIDWNLTRSPTAVTEPLAVVEVGGATVTSVRIFPGIKAEHLASILAPPVDGVVLECYGAGNAPSNNAPFLAALEAAIRRGVVVVAVTQPLRGTADLGLYATGSALARVGVVSGYDMTPEAALTKLAYLFAKGCGPDEARRLVQQDLRGELTRPEAAPEALKEARDHLAQFD